MDCIHLILKMWTCVILKLKNYKKLNLGEIVLVIVILINYLTYYHFYYTRNKHIVPFTYVISLEIMYVHLKATRIIQHCGH